MIERTKIEDTLLRMGVPAGVKGFKYITDIIQFFDEKGTNIGMTRELYPEVSERNHVTTKSVERAVRTALDIARKCEKSRDAVEHYIGFMHQKSRHSLMQFYTMLKREVESQ